MTKTRTLVCYPAVVFLCGIVCGEASPGPNTDYAGDSEATLSVNMAVEAENGESVGQNRDRGEGEIRRKRFSIALTAAAVILGGVFLFVILLSLTRFNRAIRRLLGIGKKEKPTEYIDAWSQYRLDEEADQPRSGDDG